MEHDRKADRPALLAMVLLRHLKGWDQAGLAKASKTAVSQISAYHNGRPVPREVLERIAAAADFPSHLLDSLLRVLRAFVLAAEGRSRVDRVIAEGAVAELTALAGRALDVILAPQGRQHVFRPPTPADREEAAVLWENLRPLTGRERSLLVEEASEYRTWALCEKVVAESIERAANEPREALGLAELALRIAELAPASALFRSRLRGYALACVSNGHRVCQDVRSAEDAFLRARGLWVEGAIGDPGLLTEAVLPWIEAALRREQRRFPEALQRIDEALALARGDLRGKILVSKARILETLGDPDGSTAALTEAALLIDAKRDPRTAWGVRFNLIVDLCELERFEEAMPRLSQIRELATQLGGELDLLRVSWLEGKVAAGLGRSEEAEATFETVRKKFEAESLPYNYALVSLDLSLLLLAQGKSPEVKTLAREMLWIFRSQGIHREALAALQIFCEAARQEVATVELTRSICRFLHRAQYDPELQFEREQEAGGQ